MSANEMIIAAVLAENGATAPEVDTDTLATRIASALDQVQATALAAEPADPAGE